MMTNILFCELEMLHDPGVEEWRSMCE